jgi:hypothetical protein
MTPNAGPPGGDTLGCRAKNRFMRAARLRILIAILLAGLAVTVVSSSFGDPVRWTPDGLFYQARVLELRGAEHGAAMDTAFRGPAAAELRRIDPSHVGDPAWVAYNERFYERRLTVPVAAAAIEPLSGERSLLNVSLVGYVACVLAIFGLLLLRFRLATASAVTVATILLPVLTANAQLPLTDSWGLALQTAALGAAILTLDRGLRWLPLWIGAIVLLSLTRDATWIPVLAAAFVAWRARSRIGLWLAGTGIVAALPAALLFPVPVKELMAFGLNDHRPVTDPSWTFIAERLPGAVIDLVRSDLGFVRQGEWYCGVYLGVGVVLLLAFALSSRRPRDVATILLAAAAGVGVLYTLTVPIFSGLRLELMFVPMAAFGLAAVTERLAATVATRLTRSALPRPAGAAVTHNSSLVGSSGSRS